MRQTVQLESGAEVLGALPAAHMARLIAVHALTRVLPLVAVTPPKTSGSARRSPGRTSYRRCSRYRATRTLIALIDRPNVDGTLEPQDIVGAVGLQQLEIVADVEPK